MKFPLLTTEQEDKINQASVRMSHSVSAIGAEEHKSSGNFNKQPRLPNDNISPYDMELMQEFEEDTETVFK